MCFSHLKEIQNYYATALDIRNELVQLIRMGNSIGIDWLNIIFSKHSKRSNREVLSTEEYV